MESHRPRHRCGDRFGNFHSDRDGRGGRNARRPVHHSRAGAGYHPARGHILFPPSAGPARVRPSRFRFILVALVCGLAALCFAELASMIPIAGSTYTYAYATLGEIVAWIIGWDLILEYAVSNMAVGVGFSAYFNDILDALFGCASAAVHSPSRCSSAATVPGACSTCPRFWSSCCVTIVLVRGVKESAEANNIMVVIKIAVILIFVLRRRARSRPRTGSRSCRTASAEC